MLFGKVIRVKNNGFGIVMSLDGTRYNFFSNQWKHPSLAKPAPDTPVAFELTSTGRNARRLRPLAENQLSPDQHQALARIKADVPAAPPKQLGPPPARRWLPALAISHQATTSRYYVRADLPIPLKSKLQLTKGEVVLIRFGVPLIRLPNSTTLLVAEVCQLDSTASTTQELKRALQAPPAEVAQAREKLQADLQGRTFTTPEEVELLKHLLLLADALSDQPIEAVVETTPTVAAQLQTAGQQHYLSLQTRLRTLLATPLVSGVVPVKTQILPDLLQVLPALLTQFDLPELEDALPRLSAIVPQAAWLGIVAETIAPRITTTQQVQYWRRGWLPQPAPEILVPELLTSSPEAAAEAFIQLTTSQRQADAFATLHGYIVALPATHLFSIDTLKAVFKLASKFGEEACSLTVQAVCSAPEYEEYELDLWLQGVPLPIPAAPLLLLAFRVALADTTSSTFAQLIERLKNATDPSQQLPALAAQVELEDLENRLEQLKLLLPPPSWQALLTQAVTSRIPADQRVRYWLQGWLLEPPIEQLSIDQQLDFWLQGRLPQPTSALLVAAIQAGQVQPAQVFERLATTGPKIVATVETVREYVSCLSPSQEGLLEEVLSYCSRHQELANIRAEMGGQLVFVLPDSIYADWWSRQLLPAPTGEQFWELLQRSSATTRSQLLRLASAGLVADCAARWLAQQPNNQEFAVDFLNVLPAADSAVPSSLSQSIIAAVDSANLLESWLSGQLTNLPWFIIATHLSSSTPDNQGRIVVRAATNHFLQLVQWFSTDASLGRPLALWVALAEVVASRNGQVKFSDKNENHVAFIQQFFRFLCESGLSTTRLLPWLRTLKNLVPTGRTQRYSYYNRSHYYQIDEPVRALYLATLQAMQELVSQHLCASFSPADSLRWWQAGLSPYPVVSLLDLAVFCGGLSEAYQRESLATAAKLPVALIELWYEAVNLTEANFSKKLPTISSKLQGQHLRPELLEVLWPSFSKVLTTAQQCAIWLAGWPGAAPSGWEALSAYDRMVITLRSSLAQLPPGFAPGEEELLDWLESCYWEVDQQQQAKEVLDCFRRYAKHYPGHLTDIELIIDELVLRCAPALKAWLWLRDLLDAERYYDYHGFRRARNQLSAPDMRELESRIKLREQQVFAEREPVAPKWYADTPDGGVIYKASPANFYSPAPGYLMLKLTNTPASFTRPFEFSEAHANWNEETRQLTTGYPVQVEIDVKTNEVLEVSGLSEALASLFLNREKVRLPYELEEGEGISNKGELPPEAAQRTFIDEFLSEYGAHTPSIYIREPEIAHKRADERTRSALARSRSIQRARPYSLATRLDSIFWGDEVIVSWAGAGYSRKATYFFRAPLAYQAQLIQRLSEATRSYTRLRSYLIRADQRSHRLRCHLGFVGVLRAGRQDSTSASIDNWQQRALALFSSGPSAIHPYDPDSSWTHAEDNWLLDDDYPPATQAASETPVDENPVSENPAEWLSQLVSALQQFNTHFLAGYSA
jgi:hypothetical protein